MVEDPQPHSSALAQASALHLNAQQVGDGLGFQVIELGWAWEKHNDHFIVLCSFLIPLSIAMSSFIIPHFPPVLDRVWVPVFQIPALVTLTLASVPVYVLDVFPWPLTIFARYPDFFTPTQLLLRTFKLRSFIDCRTSSPRPLLTTSGFCKAPRGLRQHYRL